MKRKIVWTICSTLGALAMGFNCCACHSDIDYRCDSDWNYVNQSRYEIGVELGAGEFDTEANFRLKPGEEHLIEIRTYATTDKLDAGDYDSPYAYYGATLTINDVHHRIEKKSVALTDNYQHKKLGTNYYQFTYVFTDENLAELMQ